MQFADVDWDPKVTGITWGKSLGWGTSQTPTSRRQKDVNCYLQAVCTYGGNTHLHPVDLGYIRTYNVWLYWWIGIIAMQSCVVLSVGISSLPRRSLISRDPRLRHLVLAHSLFCSFCDRPDVFPERSFFLIVEPQMDGILGAWAGPPN